MPDNQSAEKSSSTQSNQSKCKKVSCWKYLNCAYEAVSLLIAFLSIIFFFTLVCHYLFAEHGSTASKKNIVAYNTVYIDTLRGTREIRTLLDSIQIQNIALKDSINSYSQVIQGYNQEKADFNDKFKTILSIVGLIFAITGFFGLKSINDTRQNAIDKAIFDSKEVASAKAKEIADITAQKISAQKAEEVAREVAAKVAQNSALSYLDGEFPAYFGKWEQSYKSELEDTLRTLNQKVDELENPEAYGKVDTKHHELVEKIDELRSKYSDLMSIVERMRLDKLNR